MLPTISVFSLNVPIMVCGGTLRDLAFCVGAKRK